MKNKTRKTHLWTGNVARRDRHWRKTLPVDVEARTIEEAMKLALEQAGVDLRRGTGVSLYLERKNRPLRKRPPLSLVRPARTQ